MFIYHLHIPPPALTFRRTVCYALFWLGLGLGTFGYSMSPQSALEYRSSEFSAAERALSRAQAELRRVRMGISAGFTTVPFFGLEEDLGEPESSVELETRLPFTGEIGYLYDVAGIAGAEVGVLEAQERALSIRRDDIRDALLAHAELLRAQLNFAVEEADLTQTQTRLDTLQAQAEVSGVDEVDLIRARFALESAEFNFEQATRSLTEARELAQVYGLEGRATFEPLTFMLTAPDTESTFTYQIARLELQRQEELARQNTFFNVVEEIELTSGYIRPGFEVSGNFGWQTGRPGAGVDVVYDPLSDDDDFNWFFGVSATLQIDDQTPSEFAEAERLVRDARGEIERLETEFDELVASALDDATAAERDLQLALRNLEVNRRVIEARQADLETLSSNLDSLNRQLAAAEQQLSALEGSLGEMSSDEARRLLSERIDVQELEIRELETAIRDTEREQSLARRDLERTQANLNRDEDAIFRTWIGYITSVHGYLTLADDSFRLE